ncbi:hypothetical protein A2890_01650 [candidate division WWE3 bacterium RIFCSPLOWO2_01_FULL_53_14]|uniref:Uncharacterized protein n=1 Tax=candidate division WWE3 bacterium RIFCSPLOWO2_01_FULL_53_14 TaxID=1802628 RepID=A0A1F4VSY1_UNCKA|nr:MAG: hypothetical protein A2890_01650 [candidate division WWE3 bacterium RIFCSPLOWO2_01_FULL_53_14]
MIWSATLKGLISSAALLGIYFSIVTLLSGWEFAVSQLLRYWYWLGALTAGFGVQVGLFSYLRARHRARVSAGTVAAAGTTSGAAMLSCCAHYLANILPIIGISGISAFVGQYQTEIFGVGVLANLIGIGYLVRKIRKQ